MRTLTYKNHRDKKLTIEEVKEYIARAKRAKEEFESKSIVYRISKEGESEAKKVNDYIRQANIAKGSYFGGNN